MKRYDKKKRSLLRTYITIVAVICSILFLSFMLTYIIINKWYMKEAEQSAQARFLQAQEKTAEAEKDIINLYSTVTSSETVISYLKTSDLSERTQRLNDFSQMTGGVMKINPDVEAILLYDEAGQLIATKGTIFFPRQDSLVTNGMYGFPELLQIRKPATRISRWKCRYTAGKLREAITNWEVWSCCLAAADLRISWIPFP